MKMTQALSDWMKKEDISAEGVDLEIARVSKELVGQEQEVKFALHFVESDYLPLLLNRTNVRILVDLFGIESDDWRGRKVRVYADPNVSFGGKRVGGVRVGAVLVKQAGGKQDPSRSVAEMADDVPW